MVLLLYIMNYNPLSPIRKKNQYGIVIVYCLYLKRLTTCFHLTSNFKAVFKLCIICLTLSQSKIGVYYLISDVTILSHFEL